MQRGFPGQTSMWELTAAQRALVLGPPIKEKRAVKRLSMKELLALNPKYAAPDSISAQDDASVD